MKKLLLLAATAAMVFTSCVKSNPNSEGDAKIVVRVEGIQTTSKTRMLDEPGEANKLATPSNGRIFVIDGGNVIHSESLEIPIPTNGQTLKNGDLFPGTSQIYVLVNIPSNVSIAADYSGPWTTIRDYISSLATANADFKSPAMGNTDPTGNNGPGVPRGVDVDPTDENVATVTVPIAPLYSRLQLLGIQGGSHIASYKVTGVFLTSYYEAFTMAGASSGNIVLQDASPFTGFGDSGDWVATPAVVTASAMTTPAKVNAAAGGSEPAKTAWAYHIGAGSIATFVVRLEDIKVYEDKTSDPNDGVDYTAAKTFDNTEEGEFKGTDKAYITVKGYTSVPGGTFLRGRIYSVDPLTFDKTQLKAAPEPKEGVSITASVTVEDWVPVKLTPEI